MYFYMVIFTIYWTILGVAETIVGSLLLCGLGVVWYLFNIL